MIFHVSSSSGLALYRQLMEQVRHAVETGVLQEGDQMPGILALAEELAVSHNTIAKAYTELQHEGLLELRHGSGTYISAKWRLRSGPNRFRKAPRDANAKPRIIQTDQMTTRSLAAIDDA